MLFIIQNDYLGYGVKIMAKETTYNSRAGFRCLRNIKKQTNDLYLVHCGHQQCVANYTYNHKIPNEYHLHFVLNGAGVLEVNGRQYHIKKEDIFLIPKDVSMDYYADSENPWEYIWVTFDGAFAETYLGYAGLSAENPVAVSAIPTKDYLHLIEKMLNANELTFANEIRRVGYLFEILSILIEAQNAGKREKTQHDYPGDTYVEYAITFITNNYDHIKINDIASYVGITRSYLAAIFKKKMNVTPQEYLVNFRLKKAAELLESTNMSVQDIASQIGYKDPLTFSKMFKQIYGLSPRNYREEQHDRGV